MLYIVNKSSAPGNALSECLSRAIEGDVILLIENAVYAATLAEEESSFKHLEKGIRVAVLLPDLTARGLTAKQCIEGVELVDYVGFVELVENNKVIRSWF